MLQYHKYDCHRDVAHLGSTLWQWPCSAISARQRTIPHHRDAGHRSTLQCQCCSAPRGSSSALHSRACSADGRTQRQQQSASHLGIPNQTQETIWVAAARGPWSLAAGEVAHKRPASRDRAGSIPLHVQGTCCWVRAGDGPEFVVSVKHTENEHFHDVWNTASHHRQVMVNPFSRTGPLIQKSVSCWRLCVDRQQQHLTCGRSSAPAAARLSTQQAPCSRRCWEIPCVPCTPGESLQRAGRGHWIRATPPFLLRQELWSCSGNDGLRAVSASCPGQGSFLGSGGSAVSEYTTRMPSRRNKTRIRAVGYSSTSHPQQRVQCSQHTFTHHRSTAPVPLPTAPCSAATNCTAQRLQPLHRHCGTRTAERSWGQRAPEGDRAVKYPPVCRTSEKPLPGSRCPEEQCRRQQGKRGQPKVTELNASFGDLGSNPYPAAKFLVLLFKSLIPTLVKNRH